MHRNICANGTIVPRIEQYIQTNIDIPLIIEINSNWGGGKEQNEKRLTLGDGRREIGGERRTLIFEILQEQSVSYSPSSEGVIE